VSGPDRIAAAFQRAAGERRAALTVFLAAGDPDYATTLELSRAAVTAGADVIELGSPFSDPLADGPVIQAAYTRALAGGASTARTIQCAASVVEATGAPVVLMVALNCVLAYGLDRYCREAAAAGVSGVLIPDLPVDDAAELRAAAAGEGVATVFLAGPDSPPERIAAAAAASTGFVYVMRRRGITGAGPGAVALRRRVEEARSATTAPVAVGFGIATPAHAAELADMADGVIVGSALVDAAQRALAAGPDASAHRGPDLAAGSGGADRAARVVGERVRALRDALRKTEPSITAAQAAAGGTEPA
jgi:tryptophan synthase alpha chain